jgi:demethylmenaquinone methyltransferase/2-methoxy-6-polyprenyl-1,4-benzoquinol methylase
MLRTARRAISHEPAPIHLVRADAQRLPLRSGTFDAVFMSFTLELFDDSGIATLLAEVRRVLRGGGRLVVVCLAAGARPSLATTAYSWLHRQLPQLLDCRPIPIRRLLLRNSFVPGPGKAIRLWGLRVAVVSALPRAV